MMLGNQSVSQIEKRLGIEFPKDVKEFMLKNHQPEASNIKKGKWHCFDLPFVLVCGDMQTAETIYNSVKEKPKECKETLQFSLQGGFKTLMQHGEFILY